MNANESNAIDGIDSPFEASVEVSVGGSPDGSSNSSLENSTDRSDQAPAVASKTRQRTKSLTAFFGAIKFRVPDSTQAQIDRGFARLKSRTQSIAEFGDDDGWVRSAN